MYGVIVANKWMRAGYGKELRKFLAQQDIREIIDFGDLPVFETATTYPCILIASGSGRKSGKIRLTIPKTLSFSSLEKYVEGKIFRGVLTGFNEAFVINEETKSRLVKEDKRSREIIKPFLTGRDIKRYQKPQSKHLLIFTRRGINIDDYPAVRNYLKQFNKR